MCEPGNDLPETFSTRRSNFSFYIYQDTFVRTDAIEPMSRGWGQTRGSDGNNHRTVTAHIVMKPVEGL